MTKVHFMEPGDVITACRFRAKDFPNRPRTPDVRSVTCGLCLRNLRREATLTGRVDLTEAVDATIAAATHADGDTPARRPAVTSKPFWTPGPTTIHYKPLAWATAACGLSPMKFAALLYTTERATVDCKRCLRIVHEVIGGGAARAEPIREITAHALDIATRQDIVDLKVWLDQRLRDVATESPTNGAHATKSRYMSPAQCAVHIERTERAVRALVYRRQIPFTKVGRTLRFDRDKIDRWMERHGRYGKLLPPP